MRTIFKKTAAICMAFVIMLAMMPMLGTITGVTIPAGVAYAEETQVDVITPDGFKLHLWYGNGHASVAVRGYTGSSSEIILPTSVTYGGVTYSVAGDTGDFFVDKDAFKGNKNITKAAIPDGYYNIGAGAFSGCTGLTEVAIGNDVGQIGGWSSEGSDLSNSVFYGCENLKTYRIGGNQLVEATFRNSGVGQSSSLVIYPGVTVITKEGSVVDEMIKKWNDNSKSGYKINVKYETDPYKGNTVHPDNSGNGSSGGGANNKGEDGTPYGKGASESVVNKAITSLSSETDPKGTVFGLLKAKLVSVKKNSVTLKWSKISGATKYVVYGNTCNAKGKKYKLVKLKTTNTAKVTFKKVNNKKVKKGTYYKFMVVALDKNNKVVSTSKIVHAATKGGKFGNDKKVTTKAKKNKVSIKKGKSFKLKAKAVPQSKKLKVQRHRAVKYESSNPAVATVSSKGVIKGKKKGTCYVYAYAQVGVFAKIKVTVK